MTDAKKRRETSQLTSSARMAPLHSLGLILTISFVTRCSQDEGLDELLPFLDDDDDDWSMIGTQRLPGVAGSKSFFLTPIGGSFSFSLSRRKVRAFF